MQKKWWLLLLVLSIIGRSYTKYWIGHLEVDPLDAMLPSALERTCLVLAYKFAEKAAVTPERFYLLYNTLNKVRSIFHMMKIMRILIDSSFNAVLSFAT